MGNNDRNEDGGQGNGQQGTGGIGSGRATSTPNQRGGQPHLGNAANRSPQSAPGGTGETEGASEASMMAHADLEEIGAMDRGRANTGTRASRHSDRLDAIELADDRTDALNPRRGAAANDAAGDLGDVLSHPANNKGYISDANRETPTLGAIDDDKDNV